MGKIQIGITIDTEIHRNFSRVVGKGNVSAKIEEYMEHYIVSSTKDINEHNIELIKKECETLNNQISKASSKLNSNKEAIDKYQESINKKDKARLEKEKEIIQNALHCCHCGNIIEGKNFMTKKGKICNLCFYTFSREKAKEWY